MKPILLSIMAISLLASLACGGGGGGGASPALTPPAKALAYGNPSDASSWRLVQNPQSTGSTLLLDLLAPPGASGRGITVVLSAPSGSATWSPVSGTDLVCDRAGRWMVLEDNLRVP